MLLAADIGNTQIALGLADASGWLARWRLETDDRRTADEYGILVAEITRITANESIDEATHDEVILFTKDLVAMLDEATAIVDFFKKQDEVKRVKKRIKRRILASSFDDADLRNGAVAECVCHY